MQMFYVTVWGKVVEDWDDEEVLSNLYALSDSTVLLGELLELLRYRFEQIDFIDEPVELGFDCPLDLHCPYTRDQLLVALDFMKPSTVREGVKWLPEKNIDVFFVTLNKADKDYSPTLAEPEHHGGKFAHRSALYSPRRSWQQGAAVCP